VEEVEAKHIAAPTVASHMGVLLRYVLVFFDLIRESRRLTKDV
jgi:hypothetical protein